jgi:hypothetical protein
MKGPPCHVAVTGYTFIVQDHQRDKFRRYRKKLFLEMNPSPMVVLPPPIPTGIHIKKTPDSLIDNERVMNDSLERTKRDHSKSSSGGENSMEKQLIQCGGQPSEKCETIAAAEQILAQTTSYSQVQLSFTTAIVTNSSPTGGSAVSN